MEKLRLDILKQIKSAGPVTYNELENICKITSLKDRGTFAKNLRSLIRNELVKISKIRSTTHYVISTKGLNLIKKSQKADFEKIIYS